ncbi:MAG TPA: alpha/beta fold hydrolase [Candidatus Binataceae bacterium]
MSKEQGAQGGALWVVLLMVAIVVLIWSGSALLVAQQLRFPPSYRRPRTDHQFAPLPATIANPTEFADPKAAAGAEFEDLAIERKDGARLRAWFIAGENQTPIILLHGLGGDRRQMLPYMRFLHAAGFPVLMIDSINSGQSDDLGTGVGYGWSERADVLASEAKLQAMGFARIGALGISQGAAEAILAQSERHGLAAIVSDSAYSNLGQLLRGIPSIAMMNPLFTRTVLWAARIGLGQSVDQISPAQAAANLQCALMVIQGREDKLVTVADAKAIFAASRQPKELWIVDKARHTGALRLDPKEYANRVDQFFKAHLSRGERSAGAGSG